MIMIFLLALGAQPSALFGASISRARFSTSLPFLFPNHSPLPRSTLHLSKHDLSPPLLLLLSPPIPSLFLFLLKTYPQALLPPSSSTSNSVHHLLLPILTSSFTPPPHFSSHPHHSSLPLLPAHLAYQPRCEATYLRENRDPKPQVDKRRRRRRRVGGQVRIDQC